MTGLINFFRLLYPRDDAGRGEGAGVEVRPGDGPAHGHVQERAPHTVDRSLRRRRGELLSMNFVIEMPGRTTKSHFSLIQIFSKDS